MNQKSKAAAILLAFFLGCWGAHLFYVGEKKKAVIYLVIGLFGLFFFVPLLVSGILALIDLIRYLMMSDAEFAAMCSKNQGGQNYTNYSAPTYNQQEDDESMSITASTPDDFTFCTTCGTKIPKGSKFCPSCGNAQNG